MSYDINSRNDSITYRLATANREIRLIVESNIKPSAKPALLALWEHEKQAALDDLRALVEEIPKGEPRMDDEYFGRAADESAEFEDLGALSGTGDPQPPLEPSPDDIVPDPATAYLTLADIERETGISCVTLIRYSQQYRDRLPSEGEGNRRRYYPAAITEFEKIRNEIASRRAGGQGVMSKPRTARETPRAIQGRKRHKPSKPKPSKTGSPARRKKTRPPVVIATTAASPSRAPVSKLATEALSPIAPDLDRMAKVYQLRIQRKALDGVLSFVTEWWTRIDSEIEELEK